MYSILKAVQNSISKEIHKATTSANLFAPAYSHNYYVKCNRCLFGRSQEGECTNETEGEACVYIDEHDIWNYGPTRRGICVCEL
jgi:hypothetical protein